MTHHDAVDIIPSWSKDRRWIYFNSNRSGEEQIWKIPFDGGEAQQVTTGGARDCLESSDGRFLYFTRRREQASYKFFDIYRVPVSGGAETPVIEGLLLEQLNWTIWDNTLIYRHRLENQGRSAVSKRNLETGEVSELSRFGRETGFCFGATVSPDGQWLMHSISEPPTADLMLVENFE
jgi:Tol biopolymer transport system component